MNQDIALKSSTYVNLLPALNWQKSFDITELVGQQRPLVYQDFQRL